MDINQIKNILNKSILKRENTYIPYGKHEISNEDISFLNKSLRGSFITQGPNVNLFEEKVSNKVNAKYATAFNSATSALHIACLALNLKKGDWLWTSPISYIASSNCGLYCGANIDFVDIDSRTGLLCPHKLENKLIKAEREGNLPKVVIPVHLTGTSCDMEKIHSLSQKYGFLIIEDASHAIGAKYLNSPVGNCRFSSITVFSFHPVKIITTGEGGIATTNSEELNTKMKLLCNQGVNKEKNKFKNLPKLDWLYEQDVLGFNYRITDFQCALGISQLKRLDKIVEARNKKHDFYKGLIKSLPISFLDTPENCYSSRHLSIIKLEKSSTKIHTEIMNHLRSKGIGVTLHYYPIHLQPFYKNLGFKENYLSEAEKYPFQAISLPLFIKLKEKQQIYIINQLKLAINKYF